jgi:N-acyl-D-amino-acid deacylase
MKAHWTLISLLLLAVCPPELLAKKWTDATGQHTVEAEFVELQDGKVRLRKADGTLMALPLERLSQADQRWVQHHVAGVSNKLTTADEPSETTEVQAAHKRRFTGLTASEYQKVFGEMVAQGYRPVAIRGYGVRNEARYDVTYQKNPAGAWAARHGLSDAQFFQEDRQHKEEGMTLVVHTRFRIGNDIFHAAAWERLPLTFHTSNEIPETGATSPEMVPLDRLMRTIVREQDIPGAALAVARNGRLLFARGFGYADVQRKEPVKPDALFRLASVSKPITAVVVMHLVERGKLKLSDRVVEILPREWVSNESGLPDTRLRDVTLLQLLQHTAGFDPKKSFDPMFRSVEIAQALGMTPPPKPKDIVRYMFARPLDFDPGTRDAYSNFGYCVLGRVVEAASGKTYEAYVRDEVLSSLGISRMQIGGTRLDQRAEGEVRYYTRDNARGPAVVGPDVGKMVPVQYGGWCLEAMDAHGGWIGSAVDLVRFASALDETARVRILSKESVARMFAPPPPPVSRDANGNLAPSYYACGWSVRPISGSVGANTWHNGLLAGTSTLLVRRFDGFTWAVLFNTDQSRRGEAPAGLIDGPMHEAVSSVRRWPDHDLFPKYR